MVPLPPTYPIVASIASALSVQLNQGYFLVMYDGQFPLAYLFPMKTTPDGGYETFQSTAKVGERISTAIFCLENGLLTTFAPVGNLAAGSVSFSRPTFAAGAVTINKGTIVTTSVGGRRFITQGDVVFGGADLGPYTVAVLAEAPGYEYNAKGPFVDAGGATIPGDVDTIDFLITTPPYGDITFVVSQVADFVGGTSQDLEALGADRGVYRVDNEPPEHFRLRVRTLPDTVSPGAIRRYLDFALLPLKMTHVYELIETWQITYQTCWDAPSPHAGTPTFQPVAPTNPQYDDTLFAYDDSLDESGIGLGVARPTTPFKNRWLDSVEFRAAFIVTIPPLGLLDVSGAYDDPGMIPTDFKPLAGTTQRGTPAYDVPSAADTSIIYPDCWDGYDLEGAATVLSLWQHLQAIRAYGVAAIVEEQGM